MPQSFRSIFRQSCENSLHTLEAALRERNARALAAELHSLSGALNVFGHKALALECASAERSLKAEGDIELQVQALRQI